VPLHSKSMKSGAPAWSRLTDINYRDAVSRPRPGTSKKDVLLTTVIPYDYYREITSESRSAIHGASG
jgi:hypothetical protein